MGHAAIRLLPNLGGARLIMGLPVCRVIVLVRVKVLLRILGCQSFGFDLGTIGPVQWIGLDDLGTIKPEDTFAGVTSICRKCKRHSITASGTKHCVGDTGVPACRVEKGFTLCQFSGSLGRNYHRQRRSVFYRSAGV